MTGVLLMQQSGSTLMYNLSKLVTSQYNHVVFLKITIVIIIIGQLYLSEASTVTPLKLNVSIKFQFNYIYIGANQKNSAS